MEEKIKALIVTYYWPPAGGSGVQRWLKFVKYLRDYGVEPIVFTVKHPNYSIIDNSLKKEIPNDIEVIQIPIWEPNNIFALFNKKKTELSAGFLDSKPNFFNRILNYIRANYFIPDARKFWIKPAVKKLKKHLLDNNIEIIITTGPPHSMHLIGLSLKQKLNLKWIADFRDPWTDIDYFHQLPLTKNSKKKHEKLEKKVIKSADRVLVVGKTMKINYESLSNNIHIISNGYDNENISNENLTLDIKFSITHIGMMNNDRNPKKLWKVLSEICKEIPNFSREYEIKLIGKVSNEVLESINENNLENVNLVGYLPHSKVKEQQKTSQVLLLVVNNVPSAKMIITGKIFEYLQAKRPILAIGPKKGDLAEILEQTSAGVIVDFEDENILKSTIINLYEKYRNKNLSIDSKNIEQFHRSNLTKKLAEIIKDF